MNAKNNSKTMSVDTHGRIVDISSFSTRRVAVAA